VCVCVCERECSHVSVSLNLFLWWFPEYAESAKCQSGGIEKGRGKQIHIR